MSISSSCNRLDGNASGAQAAALLYRFCTNVKQLASTPDRAKETAAPVKKTLSDGQRLFSFTYLRAARRTSVALASTVSVTGSMDTP